MKKRALVVGGGSDIGFAICKELFVDYDIISTFYNTEKSDSRFTNVKCNLKSLSSIDNLFDHFDTLDLLVTSAFPFIETDPLKFEDFTKIDKFLRGHIYLFTKAAEKLKKKGRIINILGQSVDSGLPVAPHYGASFSYIDNLTKSINATYGRRGILSMHNILLGPVDTKLWNSVSIKDREHFEGRVISFINPEQVAKEVLHISKAEIPPTKYILDGFYSLP